MASDLNKARLAGAALAVFALAASAIPLGSETAPVVKRERTERAARPPQVANRSRFEQEPVDPSWSHDYAASLRETIEAHGGPALAADSVDCRLTGCRIAVAVADRATLFAGAHALHALDAPHHVQVLPHGVEVFIERPGITGSSPDAGIE